MRCGTYGCAATRTRRRWASGRGTWRCARTAPRASSCGARPPLARDQGACRWSVARSSARRTPIDADTGELWERIQTEFHANQRAIVESLDGLGALAPELDVDTAADLLWTLNHPEVWVRPCAGGAGRPSASSDGWATPSSAQLLAGRLRPLGCPVRPPAEVRDRGSLTVRRAFATRSLGSMENLIDGKAIAARFRAEWRCAWRGSRSARRDGGPRRGDQSATTRPEQGLRAQQGARLPVPSGCIRRCTHCPRTPRRRTCSSSFRT